MASCSPLFSLYNEIFSYEKIKEINTRKYVGLGADKLRESITAFANHYIIFVGFSFVLNLIVNLFFFIENTNGYKELNAVVSLFIFILASGFVVWMISIFKSFFELKAIEIK